MPLDTSLSRAGLSLELSVARQAVVAAAQEALSSFADPASRQAGLSFKGDVPSDPVSDADRRSEQTMSAIIAATFPDDACGGEESGLAEAGGRQWIMDGVDGTLNFVSGLEDWCVAMALVEAEEPLVAAVCAPARGELYLAARGHGATRNGLALEVSDSSLEHVPCATYIDAAKLALPGAAELHRAVAARAASMRMHGSGSLELARVARGQLSAWYQPDIPAWDWLPGRLLVEEAGGVTTLVPGRSLWHIAGSKRAVAELSALAREHG